MLGDMAGDTPTCIIRRTRNVFVARPLTRAGFSLGNGVCIEPVIDEASRSPCAEIHIDVLSKAGNVKKNVLKEEISFTLGHAA